MNNLNAYKLKFFSPLHLGQEGIGLEKTDDIIHSDTLFSAVACKLSLFYEDDIEDFINNPKYILSSAFPFKGNEFFFPKPMVKIGDEDEEHPDYGKKFKKVRFVSKKILEKIISGGKIEFSEKNILQSGLLWTDYKTIELTKSEKTIYEVREVPRVRIDRITNESEIFYFNEIIFSEKSGLFFLVKFYDETIKTKFESILRLLGDEGIGGDKSSGKGCYDLEIVEDFRIEYPELADNFISLSLFHPTKEEVDNGLLSNSSYELVTRRGWIHSVSPTPLRRKGVRMLTEGSVFKHLGKEDYGDIVKVLDSNESLGLLHNVYRYGKSFTIPIKVRENNV